MVDISCFTRSVDDKLTFHVTTSALTKRFNSLQICVVDLSGSMRCASDDKSAENGFSRLDLVKHILRSAVQSAGTNDKFVFVTYNHSASVAMDLTKMNDHGKETAVAHIDAMCADGGTNIWSGLDLGIGLGNKYQSQDCVTNVTVFTDGVANGDPPLGTLKLFEKHCQANDNPFTVSTIGFGTDNNIDSELLSGVATLGNGTFSYVPDSSMLSTYFINCLANANVTVANNASVTINCNTPKMIDVHGYSAVYSKDKVKINIGPLYNDQTKGGIITFKKPCEYSVEMKYFDPHRKSWVIVSDANLAIADMPKSECQRIQTLSVIKSAFMRRMNQFKYSKEQAIEPLRDIVETYKQDDSEFALAVIEDISDQLFNAIDNDEYWREWGKHYVQCVINAHVNKICPNFKDESTGLYATPLFREERDRIAEVYMGLGAPKPSLAAKDEVKSMGSYYNSAGPCVHGTCLVSMADGTRKAAQYIVKGDVVMTETGNTSVICTTRSTVDYQRTNMCALPSGLVVTPYHPIKHDGIWKFPIDVCEAKTVVATYIYNFVLESDHVMIINDVPYVTLGHGFVGDVREHSFFGTQKVINALKNNFGTRYQSGLVDITPNQIVRDEHTKLVCNFTNTSPFTWV
jgi:Mg-chelatase subunit ChlD